MIRLWQLPHPATFLFWTAYAICFLPEMLGSLFQNATRFDQSRDRHSYPILVFGLIASIIAAFELSISWPGAAITPNQPAMLILGSAMMLAGAAFRWYAIRALGRFFTRNVAIRPDHAIIRTGPYRTLRHPAYTGSLASMLGIGLALDNWASLAVIMAASIAVHGYRITVEEAALTAEFGESYRRYCAETRRLLPFIY